MTFSEFRYKRYAELDSTMNEARRLVLSGEYKMGELFCIRADQQSQGRGQHGKSWASPSAAGIYASVFGEFSINSESPAVSVTDLCIDLLHQYMGSFGLDYVFKLKPINDIYFDGHKLAGILVEKFTHNEKEYSVIGIGINLYKADYRLRESLISLPKAPPISLEEIIGEEKTKMLEESFLEVFSLNLKSLIFHL